MTTILLVGFYQDGDEGRRGEFLECLRRNAANRCIDTMLVFVEDATPPDVLIAAYPVLADPKIRLQPHGQRVTFQELFAQADRYFDARNCEDEIEKRAIIANADIYFDETLACLAGEDLSNKLLCLSRWDVQADGSALFFEHPSSQDAWIFQPPLRPFPCDFPLGILGCDNRLAWEAANAGYAVSNPSRTLSAYHLHLSGVRRYHARQRLPGPTLAVDAEFLVKRRESISTLSVVDQHPLPRERVVALTSLAPSAERVAMVQECIRSWRSVGLEVYSFNHPTEIPHLQQLYDVNYVPVEATAAPIFGRHYIPIHTMIQWAAAREVSALLINADIKLQMAAWEMKRIQHLTSDGLCYFVRHNHNGNLARAVREPYGIDAFLFDGRFFGAQGAMGAVADSFLCMGQPYWDYWLPYLFAARHLPLYAVEFPAAFHANHPQQWSWENWHRCGLEFARVNDEAVGDGSFDACMGLAWRVRESILRARRSIPQQPHSIRQWVQQRFGQRGPKLFVELGAHQGTDTVWLAAIPDVTIHAFEPDPRNVPPPRPNVQVHRAAIADRDGAGQLILSREGWGQVWTYSSSIKQPKNHLYRYPVSFNGAVDVQLVTLDRFCQEQNLEQIDFIWADIQGAEAEMIGGGTRTLARTRYLYTEYSDEEMYEGQPTLAEILAMLPDFRVVELWPDDVLLENRALAGG